MGSPLFQRKINDFNLNFQQQLDRETVFQLQQGVPKDKEIGEIKNAYKACIESAAAVSVELGIGSDVKKWEPKLDGCIRNIQNVYERTKDDERFNDCNKALGHLFKKLTGVELGKKVMDANVSPSGSLLRYSHSLSQAKGLAGGAL